MDYKKAVEILMDIQSDWEDGEEYEAFDLAIEALEKQIPKKYSVTEYETFNGGRLGVGYVIICSICKNPVHDFEFCPHCGQKIDWA